MDNFKKGDLVRLIIGSSEMIVSSTYGSSLVECETKKSNGELKRYYFRPESLVKCAPLLDEMKTGWENDYFG